MNHNFNLILLFLCASNTLQGQNVISKEADLSRYKESFAMGLYNEKTMDFVGNNYYNANCMIVAHGSSDYSFINIQTYNPQAGTWNDNLIHDRKVITNGNSIRVGNTTKDKDGRIVDIRQYSQWHTYKNGQEPYFNGNYKRRNRFKTRN